MTTVRIPADVDMPDRVLGPLTARQLLILSAAAGALYLFWLALGSLVPVPLFVAVSAPIAAAAAALAVGRRDGVSLDVLALAALRQRLAPRHHLAASQEVEQVPAWLTPQTGQRDHAARGGASGRGARTLSRSRLPLPARAITAAGVIDLGPDGVAAVAVASTVNFALRTPTEQESLVAVFGRYLHSLTGAVQILVRTERLDLSTQIADILDSAQHLPHTALRDAARDYARYLTQLGQQSDLLRRQVLLVLREPLVVAGAGGELGSGLIGRSNRPDKRATSASQAVLRSMHRSDRREPQVNPARRRAATARLIRRVGEAIDLLAPAGIVVTPLDPEQATAVLAAACNPDTALARSDRHTSGADVVSAAMSQASVAESPTHFDADSLAQFDEPVNDIRAELDVRDHLEDDFDLDGDLVDDLDDLDDHDLSDHHHDRRRRATLGRSRR